MPWNADTHHGWPTQPWLPFAPETDVRNVASMRNDPTSILHLYRSLLHLRRATPALQTGRFEFSDLLINALGDATATDDTIVFRRGDDWIVVLAMGDRPVELIHAIHVSIATDVALVGHALTVVPAGTAIVGRLS